MTLMNQTDFAKHINMTRSYVTQLKNAGRLILQDGKVNVEASLTRIDETKDPDKIGVVNRHASERQHKNQPDTGTTGLGMDYQSARAMKEQYHAMTAKLEYEKEIKSLIPIDQIKYISADCGTQIRTRLEALPDNLTPQLANETDEQKIKMLLTDYIEAALSEMSRALDRMSK